MSTILQSRLRPSVALGLVLALIAAMMTFGTSPASAAVDYAKVTGHAPQSPANNKVATWCGSEEAGEKFEPVNSSPYQLQDDYELVVVKAGANQQGNFANTLFGDSPSQGEWVWADTDGDGIPEVGGDDKDSISHIIVCYDTTPEPGTLKAVKAWTVTGVEGDPAGTPGTLTFNGDKKKWDTVYEYPTGDTVAVAEAGDGVAPKVEGYKCVLDTGATTYQVGDGQASTTPPTVTIASDTLITVTITNTVNCEEITPPGTLKAVKAWTVTGVEGDPAGTPGTLTFNGDKKKWDTVYEYPTGDTVAVAEAGDGVAPKVEGYKCVLDTGATTYQVGDGQASTTPPTVTIASDTLITVTITNTVNCEEITPPGTLKAVKAWTVTGVEGDPAGTPGTLTFNGDKKKWDTVYEYPTGDTVAVAEAGDGVAPKVEGYKCVLDTGATTYQVGDGQASTTPPTVTIASDTLITVTITNTVNCEEITPPGTLKAVKAWTVTGVEGDPAGTPGTLTFNGDKKKWDTVYEYPTGDTVAVAEAGDGVAPKVEGYKCVLDTGATTYQVGDGQASTTPPTVTIASDTLITVTITNTVNCEEITPPSTTLTVTKDWAYVGAPAGYTLSAADAGSLTVTVNGVATGQSWNANQPNLTVGDTALVTEAPVGAVRQPGDDTYTCEVTGSPEYAVNGGAFTTTAAGFPLAPTANSVVVRNTVTCEVVEGIEEGGETPEKTPEETPDNGAVGGSEQELAETGANVGPAGLGLLLIVSGAALLGGRRFAIR